MKKFHKIYLDEVYIIKKKFKSLKKLRNLF